MIARTKRLAALIALTFGILTAQAMADAQFTYDALRRLTTGLYDNGACVAYGYDANDNRLTQTTVVGAPATTATWGTGTWGCFEWQ